MYKNYLTIVFYIELVIKVEKAKTNINFLKYFVFLRFKIVYYQISFLFIVVFNSLVYIFLISTITYSTKGVICIDVDS